MLGDGKLSGKIRKFENHLSVTKINENMNKSFGFSFCQLVCKGNTSRSYSHNTNRTEIIKYNQESLGSCVRQE